MVPGTDLVVSREAHANNTSKYSLDGRTATFADVTEVFKSKGVDLDNNRFLILQARKRCPHQPTRGWRARPRRRALTRRACLQGEVEQISMMKPKSTGPNDEGLLEYLEDIVGSCQYVERIDAGHKQCVARGARCVTARARVQTRFPPGWRS